MAISYFSKFPIIKYKYLDESDNVNEIEVTDISYKFAIRDEAKQDAETMYNYTWQNSDRIDILSDMYYDHPRFYWLIMLSNDYFDMLNDFPMPNRVFENYIYLKYKQDAIDAGYQDWPNDVMRYTQQTVHEYRDSEGYVVDYETYMSEPGCIVKYIFDIETEENEKRRNIKLIDTDLSSNVENELEKAMNKIKGSNGTNI